MHILITGGAGFIGSNLTEFFLRERHEVVVIDNLLTGSLENMKNFQNNPKFTFIKQNIISYDFKEFEQSYDLVYHLASPASPIQYKKHPFETLRVNSEGTYKLLEFCRKTKSKKFILASTSEIYGDPMIHPQVESYWGNVNPVGPRSCYDEGKRYAEAVSYSYLRKYDLDIRIARIFNTYGPNMEQNDGRVVSNFIMQCITDKPLTVYGTGTQTRSFCYVSDLVAGLYKLGAAPGLKGEIINLGNPDERSILDLARVIKKKTKSPSDITFCPIDKDDPQQRQPNISKAKKLLNWWPRVNLDAGLQDTIEYFKTRYL